MIEATYKKGDRVRHPSRTEWGVGVVNKIEIVTRTGSTDLRVWVRFPSVGEKTLLASVAKLELVENKEFSAGSSAGSSAGFSAGFSASLHARPSVIDVDVATGGGWLASISKKTADDLMTTLPGEATDPFCSLRRRLELSTNLYRFDGTPARLVEWSIAQSGLDDPMSRFNRQELEQLYKRWIFNLDAHVAKLLGELRRERAVIDQVLLTAPPLAVKSVRRLQSSLK